MQQIPLFGLGTGTKSSNVSAQSRTNLYVERYAEPDKGPMAVYGRPGLTRYPILTLAGSETTAGAINAGVVMGPVRGMASNFVAGVTGYSSIFGVLGNVLFQVIGGTMYLQYANYLTLKPFTTSAGRVSIVNDGINIAVADGAAGYYAPSGTPAQMQPIAGVGFPQTTPSMTVVASHVIAVDPTTVGRFYWSNAGDVTTWDALSFATAESCADPLTFVFESNGELLLFGLQTLEFWAPTGDTAVFQRIGSSGANVGTDAVDTIRKVGNRCMFMGREQSGAGTYAVFILEGYTPRPVTTPDVADDIRRYGSSSATASVVTWDGHTFYVLNLGTKSWAFDTTTESWALWSTGGTRFAGNYVTQFNQYQVLSDWSDSRLYYVDDVYTDDSNVLARETTTRHVFGGMDKIACHELVIDFETGVGLTSGQGVAPQVMLQVSKDGGHTWGNELWRSLGALGQLPLARGLDAAWQCARLDVPAPRN
jgi:hypothetical protein